jgi:hypothetical protein
MHMGLSSNYYALVCTTKSREKFLFNCMKYGRRHKQTQSVINQLSPNLGVHQGVQPHIDLLTHDNVDGGNLICKGQTMHV